MTRIACTIPQAADMTGRTVRTIRSWIREGRLTAIRHPIDGQRYVPVDRLMEVERDQRRAQQATRTITAP